MSKAAYAFKVAGLGQGRRNAACQPRREAVRRVVRNR
jgi:hypothetical protein